MGGFKWASLLNVIILMGMIFFRLLLTKLLNKLMSMQFSEMGDDEYNELKNGLLRYCELDTLAMVMIYEAWREWLVGQ